MLITINILSAMSIVMGLLIPYFILLHLNNKLKKEVEGALNRVLELKVYSKITNERLIEFMEISNVNFDSQDKNWEDYHKTIKSLKEGLIMSDNNFKKIDKVFVHTLDKIDDLYSKLTEKQTLKEILETPIEVKKPACETKVGLWSMGKVNSNDIQTVTEIVNKVDFKHNNRSFVKGDIFILTEDDLKVYRNKILFYENYSYTTFASNIMKKLLKFNEQNEN
jgi:hypothetical protein